MNFVSLSPFFFFSSLSCWSRFDQLVCVRPHFELGRAFFFSSLRFVFCSFHPFVEFRPGTRQLFATSFIIVSYFFFYRLEKDGNMYTQESRKKNHTKISCVFFFFIYLFCPTSKKLPGLLVKRNKR